MLVIFTVQPPAYGRYHALRAVSNSLTKGLRAGPTDSSLRGHTEPPMTATTAYDFTFRSIDGGELPLTRFKGKALLVVNVASECGLTPQYSALEALWKANRDRGLVVLGVPANDF